MQTIADLAQYDGRAELIGGAIVPITPFGCRPGRVYGRIAFALGDYATAVGRGTALTATVAFVVPTLASGRESFSPAASYYTGPTTARSMGFPHGPPLLAVEVRNFCDFTPEYDAALALKLADYFEAGTLVVWDVDPVANTVRAYSATAPESPRVLAVTDTADAEPHLPGWRLELRTVFA